MKASKNGKKKIKIKKKFERKNILFIVICSLLLSLAMQQTMNVAQLIGCFLISFVSLSILYRDIFRYKPFYTKQKKMLVLLGFMLIGTIVFGRLVEYLLSNFSKGSGVLPVETINFGIPLPVGAMLVSLLFEPHTAIIFSFIISILSGIWLQNPYFVFYVFTGSIIGAFSVFRCKKRTDIIRGGLYVSLVNISSVIIITLLGENIDSRVLIPALIFAASSGITTSAVVSISLPVLEYFFKITTDITLLELLDLNQPLMKSLMINAPGTYHHSVIVGNLVETAAEDIGVNPLLARVTAYYHDIGKIKMPEYFVENQSSPLNKHDKLTPHMSSMIIISHVKEGLELAEEYSLPEAVKDIITQHHGNSIITYFYHKAKEGQTDIPSEEDYRYPGPRPQSRVAALVMMADAVEAASRVLTNPTPSRVTGLVDKIINHIFIDEQLDECELTLKDIHIIKQRFSYILNGILHRRIEYPGFNLNEKKSEKNSENENGGSNNKELPEKSKDRLAMAKKPGNQSPVSPESS